MAANAQYNPKHAPISSNRPGGTGYVVGGLLDRRDRRENMHVDGREVTVSGSLLQPPTRRTNDILRVVLSGAFLAVVITSSVVTRTRWDELEKLARRLEFENKDGETAAERFLSELDWKLGRTRAVFLTLVERERHTAAPEG